MDKKFIYSPLHVSHPDYVQGCEPYMNRQKIEDIELDEVADDGIEHILLDWDYALAANGQTYAEGTKHEKLLEILRHPAFKSVSIATSNGGCFESRLEDYSSFRDDTLRHSSVGLFQPFSAGTKGKIYKWDDTFWKKILYEKDCMDTPEKILMAGDSTLQDVHTPQLQGIRGAQVERYMQVWDYTKFHDNTDEDFAKSLYVSILRQAADLAVHPLQIDDVIGKQALEWSANGRQ